MIKSKDLISIIVPIYNVENYVEKCILSIINQTYSNLQIILVDDGSSDKSGNICDFYAEQDQRIQVIHQKNSGLVRARKSGLEQAKGKYIGFVDGDDYINESMYENMLQSILRSHADFVHTGYFEEQLNGVKERIDYKEQIYDIRNNRIQFLSNYVINESQAKKMTFSIWSKLFKRELIVRCYQKIPDYQSYGEDMLALLACVMESDLIYMKREAYYHYVHRNDSITNENWIKVIGDLVSLYVCVKNLLQDYNIYDNLSNQIEQWLQIQVIGNVVSSPKVRFSVQRYFYPDIMSLQGKKIVIYGAGTVGQDFYAQICRYRDCRIVAWVDKYDSNYKYDYMEVVGKEELKKYDYDILVIAVNSNEIAMQIRSELIKDGIDKNKIRWLKPQYFL
ncbi:MAG: glycosyltransferase [Lachnospiraceae bacterium]|nr:glycosyltransferase [Lachnospiraceae bacterium]